MSPTTFRLTAGVQARIVVALDSGSTGRIWVNSKQVAVSYGSTGYSPSTTNVITKEYTIFNFNYGSSTSGHSDATNGNVAMFAASLFARLVVPVAWAPLLAQNPWQIFEPYTVFDNTPIQIVTAQFATASIAAAIRSDRTASASLSAAIQSAATASATLSGAIQTAQSATSGLTAYIVASSARSSSASLSAAISDARTATSSLSAAVATARTATAALDSAIQIEATASTGASAAIREAFSLSANISGAVQASATTSASLAAVVATTNAISSGLSAAVRAEQAAFATLSAYIAADVVLTQAEVDMLTDIWQRFGLDPLAALTETETSASFGGIVLSKSGTNTITSTRSGDSAAGVASSMILDVWQRLGLDPDNPMTASETQISAGTLSQARAVSGATVTVTRTP